MMLSDVCLSVAYIEPKSRTEKPRKTKIGTHVNRTPLSRSKVKVTRQLWLAVLAGQHGHRVSNGSRCVYDVYRVTTCRPGRRHIVAASRGPTYSLFSLRQCRVPSFSRGEHEAIDQLNKSHDTDVYLKILIYFLPARRVA